MPWIAVLSHGLSGRGVQGRLFLEALVRSEAVDSQAGEWLTIAEACRYLKVSRRTLYRYMDNGELPYFFIAAGAGAKENKA